MLLTTKAAIDDRLRALATAPLRPLERWRSGLFGDGRLVPHFDPFDGGTAARVLLLLETPGPGAEPLRFVSRDNPTGTARNLARFLDEAPLDRTDTVLWNAVPWIVHDPGARNRPLRRAEIVEGLALLPGLLRLLPRLKVVILAGRIAAEARPVLTSTQPNLPIVAMPHPSPTYVCTSPDVAVRIRMALRSAVRALNRNQSSMRASVPAAPRSQ